ncbi:hypothetical protein JCM10296v2_000753 [Rhodotorula toruloides]
MDSLGSLNTALPPNEQAEALLASSFRQAALSITALFKQGKKATSKAFIAGQRQALQEVLEFLQAILENPNRNVGAGASMGVASLAGGGGAVGPVDVARLINFICARQEALKADEEDRDEDEANPPSSASAAGPSYAPPRRAASEAPAPPSPLRPGVAFGPRASTSTSSALPPRPTSAHARSYSTGMSTTSSAPASPPSSTFSPPFTRQTSIFQPHASTSASSGPPSTSTFVAPAFSLAPPSPSPLGPSPIPTFLSTPMTGQTTPLARERPGRALRSRNSSRSGSASVGGSKSASGTSTPVSTPGAGVGAGVAGADEEEIEHLGAGIKRRWASTAGSGPAGSVVELSPPPPEPVAGEGGMEVEPMADMEGWDGRGERPLKRVTRTPRNSGMGGAGTPLGLEEATGGQQR